MNHLAYAEFLPAEYRAAPLPEPTSSRWEWHGHRVHLLRAVDPDAPVRMLVVHGAGGHAAMLWPLAGRAAGAGVEVMVVDLPLYGDTAVSDPAAVRYDDWVELLCDLVRAETTADRRPLVLFGASMGGMLAYEAAARTRAVAHVVATCLLDPRDPRARRAAARWSVTGRFAPQLLALADPVLGRMRVPIRWLVDMGSMSANAELSRLCARDAKGGGTSVPLGFIADFFRYEHTLPQEFDCAPVTLVHPAADRWTPPELSTRFLDRITGPARLVLLDGCGHFPVEEPGVSQLASALRSVRDEVASSAAG
ncbi:alpha/beta hydrolase [Nocardia wallacei]|uniref:alpha/beta hydrolase n=1 Tax=Nocardia wallacei TaxID=480035 RepID=UPI0024587A44|nr:alpha/beta hydrolase [Nocardia wallacei]